MPASTDRRVRTFFRMAWLAAIVATGHVGAAKPQCSVATDIKCSKNMWGTQIDSSFSSWHLGRITRCGAARFDSSLAAMR